MCVEGKTGLCGYRWLITVSYHVIDQWDHSPIHILDNIFYEYV